MTTNFHLAPPSKTVDGMLAVPIDIQSINGVFTFDGATKTSLADVTITYIVGPTGGHPVFDLRQDITRAWLDDIVFSEADLKHHNFGTEVFTELRVIKARQSAGSVHTLRVQYNLSLPNSQMGGNYLPALEWSAGPRLRFVFGLSDLNRARYIEAWLPANLIFDQYSIDLEIRIINTLAIHSVITNSTVTNLGLNQWKLSFPKHFSAFSPMLEVLASDTLSRQSGTVLLPVSGKIVTIEAWKPMHSIVNLATQIDNIKTLLCDNENSYGAYLHGDRFVAFFNGGGMEYEGGTTTSTGALNHETFHSWFARGIKPASQADGWWDEGFTRFYDDGANDAIPFDFSDPPVLLCSRDPWQRHTPRTSYTAGSDFWKGLASLLGVSSLNGLMGDLYDKYKGNPVSTQMIEEFLLSRTGEVQIVDAFHRFVYGFGDTLPAPNLLFGDDAASGSEQREFLFRDSPKLWVRNADDGGASHQLPEYGQDNWFYARVRNKADAGQAEHFVVTFHYRNIADEQFEYPSDFLPCIAAKAEFELLPGDARIVKALWPYELVPQKNSQTCLLASVITRGNHSVASRYLWEHNNPAQKDIDLEKL